jgi:hypothetical protein
MIFNYFSEFRICWTPTKHSWLLKGTSKFGWISQSSRQRWITWPEEEKLFGNDELTNNGIWTKFFQKNICYTNTFLTSFHNIHILKFIRFTYTITWSNLKNQTNHPKPAYQFLNLPALWINKCFTYIYILLNIYSSQPTPFISINHFLFSYP